MQFDVEIDCNVIAASTVLHNYCKERNFSFEILIAADVQAGIEEDQLGSCLTDRGKSEDVVAGCIAKQQLIDSFFAK